VLQGESMKAQQTGGSGNQPHLHGWISVRLVGGHAPSSGEQAQDTL
jgi:hypothetical protein